MPKKKKVIIFTVLPLEIVFFNKKNYTIEFKNEAATIFENIL